VVEYGVTSFCPFDASSRNHALNRGTGPVYQGAVTDRLNVIQYPMQVEWEIWGGCGSCARH
jgi:hypothetical protein